MITPSKFHDGDFMDDVYAMATKGETYSKVLLWKEDLKDMVIKECTMNNSDFIDCGLEGAIFDNSTITGALYKLCDLNETSFSGCTLEDVRFVDCKLDGIDFSGAKLNRVEFLRCDGPIISEDGDWTDVSFLGSDIQDSNLSDTSMFTVYFRECNLNDTSFSDSYAIGVFFEKTTIEGADLDWASVDGIVTDGYTLGESLTDAKTKLAKDWTRRKASNKCSACCNAVLITG